MSKVLTPGPGRAISGDPFPCMQPVTRHISLALVLLLVFLIAALTAQIWLERETRRLQTDAIAAKRAQFLKALEVMAPPPALWVRIFSTTSGPCWAPR